MKTHIRIQYIVYIDYLTENKHFVNGLNISTKSFGENSDHFRQHWAHGRNKIKHFYRESHPLYLEATEP